MNYIQSLGDGLTPGARILRANAAQGYLHATTGGLHVSPRWITCGFPMPRIATSKRVTPALGNNGRALALQRRPNSLGLCNQLLESSVSRTASQPAASAPAYTAVSTL